MKFTLPAATKVRTRPAGSSALGESLGRPSALDRQLSGLDGQEACFRGGGPNYIAFLVVELEGRFAR